MSQIKIMNLTFAYDGSYDNVFENVSFVIDTDWKLGFTGRNGRGKTTFLNLLLGKFEYSGKIISKVDFEYFPFEVQNSSRNTIDIVEEIIPNYEYWQLTKELSLLQVDEDVLYRAYESLSHGERTKIMLAVLFLKENSFLLLDEPTNHLDSEARRLVCEYLKKKKGFILVSHDRLFLDNCIDHILSINKTNIEIEKGNFSSWWNNKRLRDEFELAENEKLKRDIERLSISAKKSSKWSSAVEATKFGGKNDSGLRPDRGRLGHKAAKMMKRAKCIEKRENVAIENKSKLLKNIENVTSLKITSLEADSDLLISLDNITIYYGDKSVCEDISFSVKIGDRIALKGINGSGKSSLLKLICADTISYEGDMHIKPNLIISYVSQDTSTLAGNLYNFAKEHNINEGQFFTILNKLDFSQLQFEKNIEDFSEGQKKKVLIAKSLCEKAHLYIWDEPLNFIDIFSRIQIEELILEYKPTLLFVEHDNDFIEKISTKMVGINAISPK